MSDADHPVSHADTVLALLGELAVVTSQQLPLADVKSVVDAVRWPLATDLQQLSLHLNGVARMVRHTGAKAEINNTVQDWQRQGREMMTALDEAHKQVLSFIEETDRAFAELRDPAKGEFIALTPFVSQEPFASKFLAALEQANEAMAGVKIEWWGRGDQHRRFDETQRVAQNIYVIGEVLPIVFAHHFGKEFGLSRQDKKGAGPGFRFVRAAVHTLAITLDNGSIPSDETIFAYHRKAKGKPKLKLV